MAKIKTVKMPHTDHVRGDRPIINYVLKFDVYCDKSGIFSTTLPESFVNDCKAVGIEMGLNRMKREGYVTGESLKELEMKVKELLDLLNEKEIVSDTLVIRSSIDTFCHYSAGSDGEIHANATKGGGWRCGTEDDYMAVRPYSLSVAATVMRKMTYRFKNGKEFVKYVRPDEANLCDDGRFLRGLVKMKLGGNVQEMEYTPDRAKFFADMIRGICKMNESIKDVITSPESMRSVADSGRKLLM